MNNFINLFKFFALAVLILFVHYSVFYLLPYPFNNINIIFLSVILFMISRETSLSIWLACLLFFFVELYSISPFGLILLPSVISAAFAYLLYENIFTNRSWYSAMALAASSIIVYRILYMAISLIVEFSSGKFEFVGSFLIINYIWELALTSIAMGMIIFLLSKIIMPYFESEKIAM